jgi:hypothetical protein
MLVLTTCDLPSLTLHSLLYFSIHLSTRTSTTYHPINCRPTKEGAKKMNGYHPNGSGPSTNGPSADQVQIPIGPTNQPRVLIRQLDNMNAVFNLSGVETGFANSLRRVIMADVPTICTCTSS